MKPVLLFDIDGTLISTGGAGARAFEEAFAELTGVTGALEGMRFDGATDIAIAREALERLGREAPLSLIERILARYTSLLPTHLATASDYRCHEGVEDVLEALVAAGRPFGLCTGNVIEGARAKLSHGDLWEPFASGFLGGFGGDGELRADIVRAAIARASERHGPLRPDEALVIGDTPRDVSAAHAVGVPVLAVASGRHSLEDLRATGAEFVVERLTERSALDAMGFTG